MTLLAEDRQPDIAELDEPIIVVGTGPVGIEFVRSAMKLMPGQRFVLFGSEPWEPYNRVRLSSFFAGQMNWDELMTSQKLPQSPAINIINNCPITEIDRLQKTVTDANGQTHRYKQLVLATGSRPYIPKLPGIDLKNIFTFRDMSDVEQLLARRVRSRKTVVVGGGVLGIEAARAMTRENTEVCVIDHLPYLMSNQLDESAAELLQSHLINEGLTLSLGRGIQEFGGEEKVEKIILKNGDEIECDTVILATGIRPVIDLAVGSKLSTNRGIRVNDVMQTSDENIYAIGECCEHRGKIYGLVKPGFEQARVAAASMAGQQTNYTGSMTSTQLKVVGMPAFSMGEIGEVSIKGLERELVYRNDRENIYRRLIFKNRKLIGAISIGPWDEQERVHEAIQNRRNIWLLNKRRFVKTGSLWPEENSADVSQWPASTVVCKCNQVTRGEISVAIKAGNNTPAAISECTGASAVCGSCKPLVASMLAGNVPAEAARWSPALMALGVISAIAMLLVMLLPAIPYSSTTEVSWQWDKLWRDNLLKQISGFSILGLSVIVLIMSLRKRVKKFSWLSFPFWRLVHIAVGALLVAGLAVHSGFSLGHGLNYLLAASFVGLLFVGGLSSLLISQEHRLDAVLARKLKSKLVWAHILTFWPVPALLVIHIFKTYYF